MRTRFRNAHTRLAYGIYFITMSFAELTAIETTHPIALGNFNNEIFQSMDTLASVTVGVFFRGETEKNTGG